MERANNSPSDVDEAAGIVRDHLANERTLLAWTRTALATAALGFVVAKLHLSALRGLSPSHVIFSTWAGAAFVLVGLAMMIVGLLRYVDLRSRLRGQPFRPLGWAMIVLHIGVAAAILLLFVYLLVTGYQR